MSEIKVLNSKFESTSTIKIGEAFNKDEINAGVVHQVVKALLASKRQGTACTKTKAMVSGGGKKPYKQKGTGRARQGSTRNPHMIGGGKAFGPVPRDFTQKINRKVMLKAVQSILADKFQAGKLTVLEKIDSKGKTKELNELLLSRNLLPALLVTDKHNEKVQLASRNLKNVKAIPADGFSVYEAVRFENLVIEKAALEKLLEKLR